MRRCLGTYEVSRKKNPAARKAATDFTESCLEDCHKQCDHKGWGDLEYIKQWLITELGHLTNPLPPRPGPPVGPVLEDRDR